MYGNPHYVTHWPTHLPPTNISNLHRHIIGQPSLLAPPSSGPLIYPFPTQTASTMGATSTEFTVLHPHGRPPLNSPPMSIRNFVEPLMSLVCHPTHSFRTEFPNGHYRLDKRYNKPHTHITHFNTSK